MSSTGLRLSETTSLDRDSLSLSTGAHVRCEGKGRKERCTPLMPSTVKLLKAWLQEPVRGNTTVLFPTIHGKRVSPDAVQDLMTKYIAITRQRCPSLKPKRISFHVLRYRGNGTVASRRGFHGHRPVVGSRIG